MDLVLAGLIIIADGNSWLFMTESLDAYELPQIGPGFRVSLQDQDAKEAFPLTDDNHRACFFGARASRSLRATYAALRLADSYRNIAIPLVEQDPFHSSNLALPTLANPYVPKLQVRLASAIVSAYSSIEELGLQPIPKDRNPSGQNYVRDRETGEWGPKSLEDLSSRLLRIGVNPKMEVLWSRRGAERFLESGRVTKAGRVAFKRLPRSHARDEMVSVCDALADASFLRSRVTTHGFSSSIDGLKRLQTLTYYDATNVQGVARILVLKAVLGGHAGWLRTEQVRA